MILPLWIRILYYTEPPNYQTFCSINLSNNGDYRLFLQMLYSHLVGLLWARTKCWSTTWYLFKSWLQKIALTPVLLCDKRRADFAFILYALTTVKWGWLEVLLVGLSASDSGPSMTGERISHKRLPKTCDRNMAKSSIRYPINHTRHTTMCPY